VQRQRRHQRPRTEQLAGLRWAPASWPQRAHAGTWPWLGGSGGTGVQFGLLKLIVTPFASRERLAIILDRDRRCRL